MHNFLIFSSKVSATRLKIGSHHENFQTFTGPEDL